MPDKEQGNLQRELRELGSRIDYPPTPNIARTVRRRLDSAADERIGPRAWLRMLARPGWAAAAVAIILTLSMLSPGTRSTLLESVSSFGSGEAGQAAGGASSPHSSEYAGEQTARIPSREKEPSGAAGSAAAGYGMPPGTGLGLGDRLSASEARARVGRLLLPSTPELTANSEYFCSQPRAMCAGGRSREDGVVLVLGPGPGLPPMGDADVGLLLVETPGNLDEVYSPSDRSAGANLEEVAVAGNRGYWLPDGRSLRTQPGEAENLPGAALLWERHEVALLLRADVSRAEAIRIAESVR